MVLEERGESGLEWGLFCVLDAEEDSLPSLNFAPRRRGSSQHSRVGRKRPEVRREEVVEAPDEVGNEARHSGVGLECDTAAREEASASTSTCEQAGVITLCYSVLERMVGGPRNGECGGGGGWRALLV